MDLQDKKIAVLGMGREGLELANYFYKNNIKADFFDENPLADCAKIKSMGYKTKVGKNAFNDLKQYELIFKSPGISPHHDKLVYLKSKFTSLTKLFFDIWPGIIIGVTGTKGKGTTSTLIYNILLENHIDAVLVGNIGSVILKNINHFNNNSIAVVELSSFQLQNLGASPHIAVVLDVDSEHLDYHKTVVEYREAKTEIVKHQKTDDYLIITANNPVKNLFINHTLARVVEIDKSKNDNSLWWENGYLKAIILRKECKNIIAAKDIKIKGEHNLTNIASAAAAALIIGCDKGRIVKAVRDFEGMPMRLEHLGKFSGIEIINDSASTNPKTVIAAANTMTMPTVLLMGGKNKGLNYSQAIDRLQVLNKIKKVIVYGQLRGDIKKLIAGYSKFTTVETVKQALKESKSTAERGWTILFSPGAASFDQFKNYQERGQYFNNLVFRLFN